MGSTLRDQIKSLRLFEQCNRVLATDEVWSRSLCENSPPLDHWDRIYLARLARDMAVDVATIHDQSDLVLRLLDFYKRALGEHWHGLKTVSEYAPALTERPGTVIELVNQAVQHLASSGPKEIFELHSKADKLISVNERIMAKEEIPAGERTRDEERVLVGDLVGDLSRKTWGYIAVIGGFAMLVGSVLMAAFGGPVGIAGGEAVLVSAGTLLAKGMDLVTELV